MESRKLVLAWGLVLCCSYSFSQTFTPYAPLSTPDGYAPVDDELTAYDRFPHLLDLQEQILVQATELPQEVAEVSETGVVETYTPVATLSPEPPEDLTEVQEEMVEESDKKKEEVREVPPAIEVPGVTNDIGMLPEIEAKFFTPMPYVDYGYAIEPEFYEPKRIPENKRGLRIGLASQVLHEKLVNLQYER